MAKGAGIDKRKQGSLNKVRTCSHSLFHYKIAVKFQTTSSEIFKTKQKKEYKNTNTKSIDDFQKDIFRILKECIHTDLCILHKSDVLEINSCIFKARSPHLYHVLKNKYFTTNTSPIQCYLNITEIYQQITEFIRLLYCNSDISKEEQRLIQLIFHIENNLDVINPFLEVNVSNETDDAVDLSPNTSDMADSGLETGSISFHENTESENSGTDIEESHVTDCVSTDDDFIRVSVSGDVERGNKTTPSYRKDWCHQDLIENKVAGTISNDDCVCSVSKIEKNISQSNYDRTDRELENCEIDDITRYENEVLNEPFYESDSNDNEQSCSFVPTSSFEFIEPGNSSPVTNIDRQEYSNTSEKDKSFNSKIRNVTTDNEHHVIPHSSALTLNTSSSSVNNYYFIDASSLNDDNEVTCSKKSEDQSQISLIKLQGNVSHIQSPSGSQEKQSSNLIRKTALSSGHESTAKFERELKLVEYLKPVSETKKIKRIDSATEEKPIEKEALVVEIKEADSGESNHPSPCIDNNKKAQYENEENDNDDLIAINIDNTQDSQYSLVRCNTFELESGDKLLSRFRQEDERRQGHLIFKNSIPQYSSHRVDDDLTFNGKNYPSMSYFSDSAHKNQENRDIEYSGSLNEVFYYSQSAGTSSKSFNNDNSNHANNSDKNYPITKSASDKFLADNSETDDNSTADCNSLPITLNPSSQGNRLGVMKRTKRDEMTPIVSGGVCTNDYSRPTDSPTVRRKTESTPIVSGGSVLSDHPLKEIKPTRMSSSMTTWVVDMSDCKSNLKSVNGSSSSSMSQSYSFSDSSNKNSSKVKSSEKQGSLGFFVNLKDINNSTKVLSSEKQTESNKDIPKQSCEFFIDISKTEKTINKCEKKEINNLKEHSGESSEKKNIFSMFIDLNEPNRKSYEEDTKEKKLHRLPHRSTEDENNSGHGSGGGSSSSNESRSKDKKSSVFMFIESDSPVVRRRTLSTSRPVLQRHSWNVDKSQNQNSKLTEDIAFSQEHKRAHSISIEPGIDKILQDKSSSLKASLNHEKSTSLHLSMLSTGKSSKVDVSFSSFDNEMRDTPPNSHVELLNDDRHSSLKREEFKDSSRTSEVINSSFEASMDPKAFEDDQSEISTWEKTATESTEGHTRKSETFDISSGSNSGPSPGSDNQDLDLGNYRSRSAFKEKRRENSKSTKILETHKSLTETIKKIECEFDKPEYGNLETSCEDMPSDSNTKLNDEKESKASCSGFVRLSDLDKAPIKDKVEIEENIKSRNSRYRMSNSIPEMSWVESKLAMNRTTGSCQMRIPTRKFTSIMSTSLPAKHKSPIEEFGNEGDGDGIISESDLSSMQSSMGRSGADISTEETETSSFANTKPYNRLGEDLLRMFLEEINPDVTIDVGGRRIRAHKCILSSRCQYFAAILSGGWIENAGNIISLQGYSYSSVHFALCHIYSGESNIPDSISIVELATLADMLCLEGLKEVIGYTIKIKYCHLFHKPCQLCAVGVLECMPLAAAYGLDEIYRKSLRWITRHFVRIWPCKAFAALPRELMDKCYHQHIVHMSADNVLQTIMDCDKLLATLPNVRWAEPVFRMVSNLLEAALKFLSDNFSSVLSNDSFQALGRDLTWNISRLEDNVLSAADQLPPDQACKSYTKLHKLLTTIHSDELQKPQWGSLFIDFLEKIQSRVEKCLVKEASRAARTTTWLKMDLELRRRIQELACLVILPHEPLKKSSKHSNLVQDSKTPSNRNVTNRNLESKKGKMTATEQNNKVLKPSTTAPVIKKIPPKPKSDPMERKMQDVKFLASDSGFRPKSWPNKLEVKSRYLEPRNKSVPKDTTHQSLSERVNIQHRRKIIISSSDSSRTSSPAMKRAVDKKPITKLKVAAKKDVKALSSDSLADSTGVKSTPKREGTSKSCGITRPESPSLQSKDPEIGLSVDSLAEPKKKTLTVKKSSKMDTSMSADSLMTEVTTPKSVISTKVSPTLGRPTAKSLAMERAKKSSPPVNQKSPLSVTRRASRSIENSTAASRNRVAAINAYHGPPNLRKNLLDAAKTPDISSKMMNGVIPKVNSRQSLPSTSTLPALKRDKKDTNPSSSESPSKQSPKSNGTNRPSRAIQANKKPLAKNTEVPKKFKYQNGDVIKQLTVGSRSGTFLKDEPTILKKSDMKTTQVAS
ncbi:uncharacterized protein [Chelonus insularis]|uniref:uncharacterized protein n=1 Tax=Chelonus insularis TaxID=460826 RepID=UPI00158A3B66|nr:uncharacterized protein LOC118064485 [Chelonus insularis]XP_034935007.1 uncharacterized protein LOC118064485 [Chelonus insularis]XP_034935008.1 uncharacterized protein LOC118064485 [Chelonus insularis]XP_034935009.1 uncharacterized protein LOC118064485 [Chelonus insularis]XP_034935010.1 uncharacterized protein LOC118064485 [Chelonus insularis]